ncbi:MAG: hypothetical protein DDT23_01230 [candidate division WS2 bacterium]|nr:hypothetical protein [Candidatus Lithacetigena glycinireducens]
MKMKTETKKRPICSACQSKNVITNRSGESWCRRCGWSGTVSLTLKTKKQGGKK